MEAREAAEGLTRPGKVKGRRIRWRRGTLVALAVAGGAAIYLGRRGLLIEGIPGEYIGYSLLVLAGLGVCGVNIWYGGPVDPRGDPRSEE